LFHTIPDDFVEAQNTVNLDRDNVAKLQEHEKEIAQANSTLHSIQDITETLTGQLGGFDSIWAAIVSDIDQVIRYLTFAEDMPVCSLTFSLISI
jgi:hypothetical protein